MPVPRLLAALFGVLIPLAVTASADATPHKRHPSAHLRTATYKVSAPARHPHRLHADQRARQHVAQARRHQPVRRS